MPFMIWPLFSSLNSSLSTLCSVPKKCTLILIPLPMEILIIPEMGTSDPMTIEMKLGKEYKHTEGRGGSLLLRRRGTAPTERKFKLTPEERKELAFYLAAEVGYALLLFHWRCPSIILHLVLWLTCIRIGELRKAHSIQC